MINNERLFGFSGGDSIFSEALDRLDHGLVKFPPAINDDVLAPMMERHACGDALSAALTRHITELDMMILFFEMVAKYQLCQNN